MKKPPHSIAHLKTVLSYDAATGAFTWRINASKRAKAGYTAGAVNAAGYVQIQYEGRLYYAHTLAWAFSKGAWPRVLIDHRSGNKADNRLVELREFDKSRNGLNRTCANKNSKTGVLGVTVFNGRYRAVLQRTYLGTFPTLEAAKEAYEAAKASVHKEL